MATLTYNYLNYHHHHELEPYNVDIVANYAALVCFQSFGDLYRYLNMLNCLALLLSAVSLSPR